MDDPSTSGVTEGFGLMFYNARWYDPALGRFAQADSIVPPGVQGLDRYAYVNNSPMNYVDPSGHAACDDEEGVCSGNPSKNKPSQGGLPSGNLGGSGSDDEDDNNETEISDSVNNLPKCQTGLDFENCYTFKWDMSEKEITSLDNYLYFSQIVVGSAFAIAGVLAGSNGNIPAAAVIAVWGYIEVAEIGEVRNNVLGDAKEYAKTQPDKTVTMYLGRQKDWGPLALAFSYEGNSDANMSFAPMTRIMLNYAGALGQISDLMSSLQNP